MSKFPCTRCLYSVQTFKSTSSAPAESDGAPRRTWPAAWADRVSNYPSAGWCGSSDSATGFLLCCLWTAAQSSLLRLCPTFCKPEERQNKRGGGHKKQTKWGVKLFTTGQWQMVKSSFKEAIDNFSCHVESDENQLSKVPLDFFFFFFHKEIHQYCCYCRYANTQTPINILKLTKWTWSPSRGTGAHQARNPTLLRRQQPWVYYITAAESLHREPGGWDKTRSVHIK